ncbi:hypothetical protein XENOCAPTIV_001033 [Xenoophorus captivus]|uniref:Uncharacterized protein n=1 Tax=Xenoophorus captivus TaxID=1517983 RepID=A0ABV0R617_9TELE
MSESIVRKVQPFTIGTRLSVPSVTKCQEFPQRYLPSEALDNCVLQHNLNSLYLSRSQVRAHGSRLVLPIVDQAAPMKLNPEHVAAEDHLNQNIASPSAVSRSIKKITISGSKDLSDSKTTLGQVLLSKVGNDELQPAQGQALEKLNREKSVKAEAWIKSKLQDLKDGCNVQYCPLQDWEEASQTLQRDLKDFENTLIQLNQLICKLNPTSDLVKKQLSQLREQWQNLKQMAANQMRALGGARSLQEFNQKVDKLEAWIKEKSSAALAHPGLCCRRLPCLTCRSDRTTHSLFGSTFTREDADLLTPAREAQYITGSETHGIMGKEVKEEQNRLKGCSVSRLAVSAHL